jgi:glycosyltransferase 2 family protein
LPVGEAVRRWRWRILASLAVGVTVYWVLRHGGLPVLPPSFASLRPWAVPVYAATLVGVHLARALRWRHLLRPLGDVSARAILAASWVGFAAIMWLPLRSGEVVRPLLVARQGRVRVWEATGTIGAERVLDGLSMTAILLVALGTSRTLDPLPDRIGDLELPVAAVRGAAWLAMAVFVAAFLLMLLFYWRREQGVRLVQALFGRISQRAASRVADVVTGVAEGLRFLPAPRRLAPFAAETMLYWGLNACGLWLLGRGTGLELGLDQAAVVMGVLGLGILTPTAPGYFGTFQLSIYVGLAMFVDAAHVTGEGSVFVFVAYVCQVAVHGLGALVGFLLRERAPDNLAAPSRAA